jgi:hypothetical protein
MAEASKETTENTKKEKLEPVVSAVFEGGVILEMYYDQKEKRTGFFLLKEGGLSKVNDYALDPQHKLFPYSAKNNLIKNRIVLFPSEPEDYSSEESLIQEIQDFIHRYVDVTPLFEKIASYYVLFSWVYDDFKELPYLRFRGDYGSGKSRALQTIGSISRVPIFASGASTISPVFRMIDAFQGTLIIDEGDFRFSDEKAEMVKILNNGNVKGFPVLRSEVSNNREFNPRAYQVYGPKIVATRGSFDDKALESRFITEVMGQRKLRDDIPINLPDSFDEEALHLRNKLLLFRFRNLGKQRADAELVDRSIEPRLNQIFVPLLSIIKDENTRRALREVARQYDRDIVSDRGTETEAQVLEVIRDLLASDENVKPSVKEITKWFADRFGEDYERKVTTKWIGNIIRKRLNLKTTKSHGAHIIIPSEFRKLARLYEKYDLENPSGDMGDMGDQKSGIEMPGTKETLF